MAGVKTMANEKVLLKEDVEARLNKEHNLTTTEQNVVRMRHGLSLEGDLSLKNENISQEMENRLRDIQAATYERYFTRNALKNKIVDKLNKIK